MYARCGVPEYFVFDIAAQTVLAWRLVPGERRYLPVLGQYDRWESEVLGLTLTIEHRRLRFYQGTALLLETPEWIARVQEVAAVQSARAEQESARAEALAVRIAELEAELRRLKD